MLNTLNKRDWKEDEREVEVEENRREDKEKIMKDGERPNLAQMVNGMKKRDDGGVPPTV